jgi:hypothetical protein
VLHALQKQQRKKNIMAASKEKVRMTLEDGAGAVIESGGITVRFNESGIAVNVQGTTITVDKKGMVTTQAASNACPGPRAGDSSKPDTGAPLKSAL